ncbi:predicted protein [Uncinocarpus reesii 1704]|uniref:5'-3' DNA helicase ZGRF1-like N-terminal domain-containing protein n=1 Tax=Uncinocarpus reesii (strain UAMH 1704) TaxID=336963 RepID=C4JN42_UNCRE|nr:uncharacterized protein UREG_04250 [Uncinocarpus reesii 1704]EEP79404.1 predicted protein [Uncinocarpus reesii 1704]
MDSGTSFRAATSVAVLPSQSTAPVIKFQCLFTYDLKRKAKRWQDGFLRFHTFNRRVMVYGTSGDFVGDLHMRESNTVQDGDQLELERGVLVDVGERLEKTETDLSELLDKRKSNLAASPARRAFLQTPAPSLMTAKSKSLNELLGKNRTPIGKAALPTKSPFDIRHETGRDTTGHTPGRPSKRRKLSPPAEIEQENDRPRARPKHAVATEDPNDVSLSFQPASALKITPLNRAESGRKSRKTVESNQKSISAMLQGVQGAMAFPSPVENPRKKLMYLELTKQTREGKPSHRNAAAGGSKGIAPRNGVEPLEANTSQPPPQPSKGQKDNIAQLPQPQPRAFSRSHSDVPPAQNANKPTPPLNPPSPSGLNPGRRHIPPTKGLQKSLSDTSMLRARPGLSRGLQTRLTTMGNTSAPSDTINEDEQGPWTSEALDLFDWWPPGRPKPELKAG